VKDVENGVDFSHLPSIHSKWELAPCLVRVAKTSSGPIPQSFLISGYKGKTKIN